MPAQGRLGDKAQAPADAHGCPACPHPSAGPAISGSADVNVNGRPALRKDDMGIHAACCGPNMWTAAKGSATVFINGRAAYRVGDPARHCGGVGRLVEGSGDVFVGESTSVGAGRQAPPPEAHTEAAGAGGAAATQAAGQGGAAAAQAAAGDQAHAGDAASTAGSSPDTGTRTPPVAAPEEPRSWIQVVLRDDQGWPLADEPYWIELPDGTVREGKLDAAGRVRLDDIPEGTCKLRLPEGELAEVPPRPAGAAAQKEEPLHWIEVVLRDEDGRPLADEELRIQLADGTVRQSRLDSGGRVRLDGIPPGPCRVWLPEGAER